MKFVVGKVAAVTNFHNAVTQCYSVCLHIPSQLWDYIFQKRTVHCLTVQQIWEITVGKNPSACKLVRHLSIQNYTELRHVWKILLKLIVKKPFYFILRVLYLLPAARRRSVIWYESCKKLICVSANLLWKNVKVKLLNMLLLIREMLYYLQKIIYPN